MIDLSTAGDVHGLNRELAYLFKKNCQQIIFMKIESTTKTTDLKFDPSYFT